VLQIDQTNFSVTIPGRSYLFEDKLQGSAYWVNAFNRLGTESSLDDVEAKYEPLVIDSAPPTANDDEDAEYAEYGPDVIDDAGRRTGRNTQSFFARFSYDDDEEEVGDVANQRFKSVEDVEEVLYKTI
jgi:hypothetical protein